MNNNSSSGGVAILFTGFAVLYAVILLVIVWAYVRIIRRTGYSGWWILAGLVPIFNVVMFFLWAFREWPIQRELNQLRAWAQTQQQPRPGYGPPYPPPNPTRSW